MSENREILEERRREMLERFRARRGEPRRQEDDRHRFHEMLGRYFEPFVRSPEIDPETGRNARASQEAVQNFLATARTLKREHATQALAEPSSPAAPVSGLASLASQVVNEHFAERFFRWMGSTPLDQGLSETPLDELDGLLDELQLRRRALEAMLKITDGEIEALDAEIRARKTLSHGSA